MSSASEGRVNKEITVICEPDATTGIIAALATDDKHVPNKPGWRHLVGTISGPEGTPYEGGRFDVDILIPRQYPFEPPKMKFETRMWVYVIDAMMHYCLNQVFYDNIATNLHLFLWTVVGIRTSLLKQVQYVWWVPLSDPDKVLFFAIASAASCLQLSSTNTLLHF